MNDLLDYISKLLVSLVTGNFRLGFCIHLLPSPGFIWHYILKSPNQCIKLIDVKKGLSSVF